MHGLVSLAALIGAWVWREPTWSLRNDCTMNCPFWQKIHTIDLPLLHLSARCSLTVPICKLKNCPWYMAKWNMNFCLLFWPYYCSPQPYLPTWHDKNRDMMIMCGHSVSQSVTAGLVKYATCHPDGPLK